MFRPAPTFDVHDNMHSDEKINSAKTQDEAMKVIVDDMKKNPHRCYSIYKVTLEEKNKVWFGDSWDVGQYLEEHNASYNDVNDVHKHSARRLFW